MKKIINKLAVLLLLALIVVACGGGGGGGSTTPVADNNGTDGNGTNGGTTTTSTLVSIAISPSNTTITAGENAQYSAVGTFSDGTTRAVSVAWSTTNQAVVMINSNGLATAVGVGTCNVTATSGSVSKSTPVTVANPIPTGFRIPDTGQVESYTQTPGEDSDYAVNPMSYTDNGNGTVTDNVTGLIWAKEVTASNVDLAQGREYCGDMVVGGQADWRLPSIRELVSLVKICNEPSCKDIDTQYFPISTHYPYWSASRADSNMSNVYHWVLDFGNGYPEKLNTRYGGYALCVRGAPHFNTPLLTDNGNGTVTDSGTRLTWQQGESVTMNWEGALVYCEGLALAGNTDWRLPNYKELLSIMKDGVVAHPMASTVMFPGVFSEHYWSSTTSSDGSALCVNFYDGDTSVYHDAQDNDNKMNPKYTRCVRGGQ